MTDKLREFDDSLGRCIHCDLLIFRSDDNWRLSSFGHTELVHSKCHSEYMNKASQI